MEFVVAVVAFLFGRCLVVVGAVVALVVAAAILCGAVVVLLALLSCSSVLMFSAVGVVRLTFPPCCLICCSDVACVDVAVAFLFLSVRNACPTSLDRNVFVCSSPDYCHSTQTVMARLQTQEASGSTNLDDDVDSLLDARMKGERDSMDSNHGAPRVAGIALRSQLADIKVRRMISSSRNL